MAPTKQATTETAGTHEPETNGTPAPQTAEQVAEVERAVGGKSAALAKVPVRMGLAPTTIEEGWRLAQLMAQSELVPKGYRGRPADILICIQYGMEVGLPPMAALHGVFVTNGRPSLWGEAFLAVIMASPRYRDHDEYYEVGGVRKEYLTDADLQKDDTTAVCTFWRTDSGRGRTATFSIARAKKAKLWGKEGPWQTFPDRMLKMRARGFAGRDAFADVLRGAVTSEEAQDGAVLDEPSPAPLREVRRISESGANLAKEPAKAAAKEPAPETTQFGPVKVKGLEQFLGGYAVALSDGHKVDVTNDLDALELEKLVGTDYQVTLTCLKRGPEAFELQAFRMAD
jgi:hypothetical protein